MKSCCQYLIEPLEYFSVIYNQLKSWFCTALMLTCWMMKVKMQLSLLVKMDS